jgi:aromatic-L-amino-acid/L-tryptophan decarboxylase
MTEPLAPPSPAELMRTSDDADIADGTAWLERLMPAIRAYRLGEREPYPVYRSGTVASDPVSLPDEGVGLDGVLDELGATVEAGCRVAAPGFFGFVTTGATTSGIAAAAAIATAGGQRYGLHSFNALEETGLRWLGQLCGLPDGVAGVFTSGGSTANLLALGAARQAALERHGIDASEDGLPPDFRGRIYASPRAHRTIHRAAGVLGLGRSAVTEISTDETDRIDLDALVAALTDDAARGITPVAVVAIAGTTDTGSIDPIGDVIEIGRRFGAWVHVDGAYGLIANASPSLRHLFADVEDADSWIVDPHKWLATGLGVGATFVRDGALLTRAFAEGAAPYLEGSFNEESEPHAQFDTIAGPWADQSMELSAPPRGALVWAVLREIGAAGVARRVDRHVAFARYVADRALADDALELLLEPTLSVACLAYRTRDPRDADRVNEAILSRLRRETSVMPTSTRVRGRYAIRPCFINPRTAFEDVDLMVDSIVRFGRDLDR